MKNDGGPAFPQNRVWNADRGEYEDSQQYPGMTLRDYFAAKAMQALIQSTYGDGFYEAAGVAAHAYQMADAMLAEREKPTQ